MTTDLSSGTGSTAWDTPWVAVLALSAAEHEVLVVLGEADLFTAQRLHDELLAALPDPPRPVLVELAALTFCDLSGLEALTAAARAAEEAGVRITFRGQSPQLLWLQRMTAGVGGRGWASTALPVSSVSRHSA